MLRCKLQTLLVKSTLYIGSVHTRSSHSVLRQVSVVCPKALYWLMLGWPLCNIAQGLVCVSSSVNLKIWTTVLRNSWACFLLLGDAPGRFSAMRKTITITLTKVTPRLSKLARLASVGCVLCWRCSSYLYVCCYGRWQWVKSGLFALQECQYVIWMWVHVCARALKNIGTDPNILA